MDYKNRLTWLDVYKGFGMIFVVVGHVYLNDIIYNWLYSFHMPLFFFASGYVYKRKSIKNDFVDRIYSVVVPYFSFGVIILLYWLLLERRFRYSSQSTLQAISGLFLGQANLLDFNIHMWFLPCFFVTVVFYNVLKNLTDNRITYSVTIIMSIIFAATSLPYLPWGVNLVLKYIGFFALGNIANECELVTEIRENKFTINMVLAFLFIIINFAISYITNSLMVWFVNGTIGILGWLILSVIINKNAILQYLGKISLVILCIHGPLYRIIVKVVSLVLSIDTDSLRSNLLLSMFVVLFTLCGAVIIYEALKRIAPWMIVNGR